ncbi:class E sortase [Klenkia brasiliensis]|uniref:Sortase A n=1 Tax=Klenkia brasiliensis TaxID=333142 RepID=A0A1G7XPD0_9ACTN|nr:class E sortase [Klenkia brasiliensis]SDG86038.1 sortase A [Klenkia brasiliensis]
MDDADTGGPRRGRHAPEEPTAQAPLPVPEDATVRHTWQPELNPAEPATGRHAVVDDRARWDDDTDVAIDPVQDGPHDAVPADAVTADGDHDGDRGAAPAAAARPARTTGDLVRTGVRGVGQLLVTAGLVVLLFVVYEVWITDLTSDRKQDALSQELRDDWEGDDPTVPTLPDGGISEVPLGQGFAFIRIPRFGADYVKVILEGTDEDELVEGPGHYVDSAMPGEQGNFALAGHRVGKGSPFLDLDQLQPGDPIVIETQTTWFVYRVLGDDDPNGVPGQQIVLPTDVSVIAPTPNGPLTGPASGAYLTLTTCHPKFSARERLIVHAVLDGSPIPKSDAPQGPPALSEG